METKIKIPAYKVKVGDALCFAEYTVLVESIKRTSSGSIVFSANGGEWTCYCSASILCDVLSDG